MAGTDRGVITLAFGVTKYIEMAKTLARSLELHSPHLPRAIVTDCTDDGELLELFDVVIAYDQSLGSNVRQKLFLDRYSPYSKTLFVDSDSIVSSDIDFIFRELDGVDFTVPGEDFLVMGQKDPFFDVDIVLKHYGFASIPNFNGGLYYFEKGQISTAVFGSARDILDQRHELGLFDFRGDGPADEPIMAIAMKLHGREMFQDHGTMMRTPIGLRGALDIDVISGKNTFQKHSKVVSPAVIHFAAQWNEHPIYYREATRLKNIAEGNGDRNNSLNWFQTRFGYQIAWSRFWGKRVWRNPRHIKRLVLKPWAMIHRFRKRQ